MTRTGQAGGAGPGAASLTTLSPPALSLHEARVTWPLLCKRDQLINVQQTGSGRDRDATHFSDEDGLQGRHLPEGTVGAWRGEAPAPGSSSTVSPQEASTPKLTLRVRSRRPVRRSLGVRDLPVSGAADGHCPVLPPRLRLSAEVRLRDQRAWGQHTLHLSP